MNTEIERLVRQYDAGTIARRSFVTAMAAPASGGRARFDREAMKQLAERGVEGRIRMRGDVRELHFPDPDGIGVQLQDVSDQG
jgi:hypothetical protein